MRSLKLAVLAAAAAAVFTLAPKSQAAAPQVSFGVNIGAAPVCPYGYYDFSPYNCAPYGYYGPEWFTNGVFIGAGPWYHGHAGFYGHVDTHYHPNYGYHGAYPAHGAGSFHGYHGDFHGNAMMGPHGEFHGGGHPR